MESVDKTKAVSENEKGGSVGSLSYPNCKNERKPVKEK